MEDLRKVEVVLTRESSEDKGLRTSNSELRRVQILRMTEEAYEQDGLLTQEDLSRLLGVSVRQVRRDIKALVDTGYRVLLRGRMQDIGRGVSHKVWIVNLYLEWKTYSEIRRITGHTVDAIKRYLNDFPIVDKLRFINTLTSAPERSPPCSLALLIRRTIVFMSRSLFLR